MNIENDAYEEMLTRSRGFDHDFASAVGESLSKLNRRKSRWNIWRLDSIKIRYVGSI